MHSTKTLSYLNTKLFSVFTGYEAIFILSIGAAKLMQKLLTVCPKLLMNYQSMYIVFYNNIP